MQCLRVSLSLFLLCCIPFPLGFLNHPVRSGCCGCRQFPFSSIVHQIDYFFPSIVPDKTSQLTHPVRTRLAPSHRPGTHPFRIHAAYMAFRTAPKDMFVTKCTLNIFPVPRQIFSAFLYRVITSFIMIFNPGQKLFGRKKLIFINIFIKPPFCNRFLIQGIPGYPVNIFHQMEPVCHQLAFPDIILRRTDPACPVAVDINALSNIIVIMLSNIGIHLFP